MAKKIGGTPVIHNLDIQIIFDIILIRDILSRKGEQRPRLHGLRLGFKQEYRLLKGTIKWTKNIG